jgi:Carbohydrate esterase, sialic acid-specific acetylesterase
VLEYRFRSEACPAGTNFIERGLDRPAALRSICAAMRLLKFLLVIIGVVGAYGYGIASYAYRLFPMEQLGVLKRTMLPDIGRLSGSKVFADTTGREEVSCWSIDHDAAVILAMGQSNAANYGETLYHPIQPVFNFNWSDGKCYKADDPLLGSTGDRGSVWTRLGDALVETKRFKQVVIVPVGVGGSSVRDWAGPDGPAARAVRAKEALGRVGLHITHVLWHQGEADYEMHKEVYARLFARMTDYIRSNGINAPMFVATATICNNYGASQIREAQRELPLRMANVFAGPDTDALESIYDRSDNLCHFSDRGLALHARLWRDVLLRHQERAGYNF